MKDSAHEATSLFSAKRGLSRRALLGLAASAAGTVLVSQATGCASSVSGTDDGTDDNGTTGCVLTAALTEGPYFVDEKLNRFDIRTDPATGAVSPGLPLELIFNVSRVSSSACTPLSAAYLDVWHCDATGIYSDVTGAVGKRFLRGYQITDVNGLARFSTIYPGWYSGRAVHIHFKVRLFTGSAETYEFTSQFFLPEAVNNAVFAQAPYRGAADVRNTNDGIYNSLSSSEKAALTLQTQQSGSGYTGVINLGVRLT